MSTIPFTPIEGYLALPRIRPLGHVPAPFGRDWALLPPGYSVRAELKALYAAMLRTFCLSDQAIRSLCRWSPLGEPHASASADRSESAAIAAQATAFGVSPEAVMHMAVETPVTAHAVEPAYATAARGYGNHWGALAGGACVLGGAAVLAWIGFDHLAPRHPGAHVAGNVATHRGSQSADLRPPAPLANRAVTNPTVSAPAARAASVRSVSNPAAAFAPAASLPAAPASSTAPTQAVPSAPTRISTDRPGSRRQSHLREKAGRPHEQNRQHGARFVAANQSPHAAAYAGDLPRIAAPGVAASLSPRPSAAGSYSPPAPARLGVDEYAGVSMSAAMRRRDLAPPPHAGSSINTSGTNGTEWMNHLSQRRVTEIPDQFAK